MKSWESIQRISPCERYLLSMGIQNRARQPGKWLIHCHIGDHTMNNNVEIQGGGGLMMMIDAT
jgi:hypothetical protein